MKVTGFPDNSATAVANFEKKWPEFMTFSRYLETSNAVVTFRVPDSGVPVRWETKK
jgi:hypothetical protein